MELILCWDIYDYCCYWKHTWLLLHQNSDNYDEHYKMMIRLYLIPSWIDIYLGYQQPNGFNL